MKTYYNRETDQTFSVDENTCVYCATTEDNLPPWWPSCDLSIAEISGIQFGGCAGYAYMAVCDHASACDHMGIHGDEVLSYLDDIFGETPAIPAGYSSWSGLATYYLSLAVECYVSQYNVKRMIAALED
jgi:hypothetical protein